MIAIQGTKIHKGIIQSHKTTPVQIISRFDMHANPPWYIPTYVGDMFFPIQFTANDDHKETYFYKLNW